MVQVTLGKKREKKIIKNKAKELTLLEIEETEKRIKSHIEKDISHDELFELIMYELLLFSSTHHDEETLQDKSWEYFDNNKKLHYIIP